MSAPIGRNPTPGNPSTGGGNYFGGPRGFAAGVTSVLVNFLLNYERGNAAQLQKDVAAINAATTKNNADQQAYASKIATLQSQIAQGKLAQLKLDVSSTTAYKELVGLQQKANLEVTAYGRVTKQTTADLLEQEAFIKTRLGLTTTEANALRGMADRQAQLLADEEALNAARQEGVALIQQQSFAQRAEQAAQQGVSRLGSLALGLIGGTIGGALVTGAIVGPLQDALNGITTSLDHMADPAKYATEAMKGLADQVSAVASKENLTNLQAAVEVTKQLSQLTGGRSGSLTPALAQAPNDQALKDQLDQYQKLIDLSRGVDQARSQSITQLAEMNAEVDKTNGNLQTMGFLEHFQAGEFEAYLNQAGDAIRGLPGPLQAVAFALSGTDWKAYEKGAVDAANGLGDVASQAASAADVVKYLNDLQQQALDKSVAEVFNVQVGAANDALDAFKQHATAATQTAINGINATFDALVNGVQNRADSEVADLQKKLQNLTLTPSARTTGLEDQLKALSNAEPSKRTQELADAIDHLNAAQDKAHYLAQLADIDQKIYLEKLAERLAATKDQINYEDYQGQARVTAIDAELKQMQDRNDAQDRFNKLLDLQYQINQGVKRQSNETIQDFISRRAQYYRGLLQQAADLRAQGPKADLEAEKERVQQSIDLKQLEDQRRQLIDDRAKKIYLQGLQDQLAASKAKDAQELQNRRDTLQKELDASKKADQAALDAKRQALQDQISAVQKNASQTIDHLNTVRNAEIQAAQDQRDKSIAYAQQVTDQKIKQLQIQADQAKQWTNYANIQQLNAMIQGATTQAQVQALAGQVAGLAWTINYLEQTGYWMGLTPGSWGQLVGGYAAAVHNLGNAYARVNKPAPPPVSGAGGGFAEGGVFRLGNFNTPHGDIRWGDGNGEELGMNLGHGIGAVLSNKVAQALKESSGVGSQSLIGQVAMQSSGDFYRDQAALKRLVKDTVRHELKH